MVISFNRVAEIYDETRSFPIFVMDKVIKTLMDELGDYKSILDAGVGTARFSKPLQDHGYYVVGIDVSLGMLKKAVDKGMGNLLISSVCSLPFRNNSFDTTISVGLLHLVKEWKVALREISRVTRHLLVSVIHRERSPASEEYRNLLIAHGWQFTQLGIAERELEAILKPVKSIEVTTYEAGVRQSLAFLEQKAYSYQWSIPEETHRQFMKQLKTKSFPKAYSEKVEVLIWNIKDIRDFVRLRED